MNTKPHLGEHRQKCSQPDSKIAWICRAVSR